MAANKKLLILPGDGIGPEVMREVRRVIDWMDRRRMVTFDVMDDHVGGSAIDTGTSETGCLGAPEALSATSGVAPRVSSGAARRT